MSIMHGNCLEVLPTLNAESVHCCVTSPPYWGLRDYGEPGQLGLEATPEEYVEKMVELFREVRRVLRDDGTLWLNLGDSYWGGKGQSGQGSPEYQEARKDVSINKPYHQIAGSKLTRPTDGKHNIIKPKDLVGIPWRVAFALQADGWYLRQDIIWHKPNPMPESVTDRCTKAHEYVFLMSKSAKYWYDADAIAEKAMQPHGDPSLTSQHKQKAIGQNQTGTLGTNQGKETRNKRSVWTVTTKPYKGAHFATFPPDLIEPCIKAGCPEGGTVLDPFMGSGTTAYVSRELGRNYLGVELNKDYIALASKRLNQNLLPI